MQRRSFLALLASAPIAALAPLPAILAQRQTFLSAATGPTTIMVTSGGTGYVFEAAGHVYTWDGATLRPLGELDDLQREHSEIVQRLHACSHSHGPR